MEGVVGESDELRELFRIVERVANSLCTVLITGESGTGKEVVANAVHRASLRAHKPFVVVNCGAIPENLLESELFGHVRGAFTGAATNKPGRVALAEGGTLFLDEVGELPLPLQVKLLRLLQQHEYSRVGESRTCQADLRIVAATNVVLKQAVLNGSFRKDLFYRLNVINLHVPPLREHASDIPALIEHFLKTTSVRTGKHGVTLSPAAMKLMSSWSWPGNVRELENTIERAVVFCRGNVIDPVDLPACVRGLGSTRPAAPGTTLPGSGVDLRRAVELFENDLIRQALERTGWNKNQAARLLQVNRTTLVEMLKRKRLASNVA
jgi:transcriptional regulator with GAF, ATPase, and Fis domain